MIHTPRSVYTESQHLLDTHENVMLPTQSHMHDTWVWTVALTCRSHRLISSKEFLHVTSFCCANNHLWLTSSLSEVAPRSPYVWRKQQWRSTAMFFCVFCFLYIKHLFISFSKISYIYIYVSVILHCIFDYSCYRFLSCISSVIVISSVICYLLSVIFENDIYKCFI